MKKYDLPITEQQRNALIADVKYHLFNYDAREEEWDERHDMVLDRDIPRSSLDLNNYVSFACNNRQFAVYSYTITVYEEDRIPWYFIMPKKVLDILFADRVRKYVDSFPEMSGYTKRLSDYGSVRYESGVLYGITFFDMPHDHYIDMDLTEDEYCQVMGGLTASIERHAMKAALKEKESAIELQRELNNKLGINF